MRSLFPTSVGARHNVINTNHKPLKLYTQHHDKFTAATKVKSEAAQEHFDGKTTE